MEAILSKLLGGEFEDPKMSLNEEEIEKTFNIINDLLVFMSKKCRESIALADNL